MLHFIEAYYPTAEGESLYLPMQIADKISKVQNDEQFGATVYLTTHLKLLCAFSFILFVFLLLVAFSLETLIVFLLGTKHYSTSIHSFGRKYMVLVLYVRITKEILNNELHGIWNF